MPLLQQAYEQETAKTDGVVILTVNVQDTSSKAKDFLQANKYTLPVLMDDGGRIARAYGVGAIPITFFINRDGSVRYIKRGMFLSINELNVAMGRIR